MCLRCFGDPFSRFIDDNMLGHGITEIWITMSLLNKWQSRFEIESMNRCYLEQIKCHENHEIWYKWWWQLMEIMKNRTHAKHHWNWTLRPNWITEFVTLHCKYKYKQTKCIAYLTQLPSAKTLIHSPMEHISQSQNYSLEFDNHTTLNAPNSILLFYFLQISKPIHFHQLYL